jgi:hypothetical protein
MAYAEATRWGREPALREDAAGVGSDFDLAAA